MHVGTRTYLGAVLFVLTCSASARIVQGSCVGYGSVTKSDTWTYTSSNAKKKEFHLKAGTRLGWISAANYGKRKCDDGLCRVVFMKDNRKSGPAPPSTWIRESDIAVFRFDDGEERPGFASGQVCSPLTGTIQLEWTSGVLFSSEEKCKELGITPAEEPVILEEEGKSKK